MIAGDFEVINSTTRVLYLMGSIQLLSPRLQITLSKTSLKARVFLPNCRELDSSNVSSRANYKHMLNYIIMFKVLYMLKFYMLKILRLFRHFHEEP